MSTTTLDRPKNNAVLSNNLALGCDWRIGKSEMYTSTIRHANIIKHILKIDRRRYVSISNLKPWPMLVGRIVAKWARFLSSEHMYCVPTIRLIGKCSISSFEATSAAVNVRSCMFSMAEEAAEVIVLIWEAPDATRLLVRDAGLDTLLWGVCSALCCITSRLLV